MKVEGGMRSATVTGVRVDAVTMADTVRIVMGWTTSDIVRLAVGVNAHVCNLATKNAVFRNRVAGADLAYADGQSVIWAARLLRHRLPERVATTDLVFPLMAVCAAEGKRVFFYGGAEGIAEQAAERIRALHPTIAIRTSHGFVAHDDMDAVVEAVRDHGTDILLVGLGDPLQQEWIAEYRERLGVPALLSCGGLFDWTSGSNRRAPRWMIAAGLEWAWRLGMEPRRLARRYLLGNPAFIARVVAQLLRRERS